MAGRGVRQDEQRDQQQVGEDEDEHEALPPTEAACCRHEHEADTGDGHRIVGAHVEVLQGKPNADELRGDGQEVQDEQVGDGEGPPELSVALPDEPTMAHAGYCTESHHHLLVHDQHGDQERQDPQQGQPEVLSGLRVGGDASGIIVTDHHDDPRPEDGEEREQACLGALAARAVMVRDGAEGPSDAVVTRLGRLSGHCSPPLRSHGSGAHVPR